MCVIIRKIAGSNASDGILDNIRRLEERCEYLGKELEVAKKEKVETRRQSTECQARIEAEVAIKRASEREVSGKESLRRRIIEKDVAARRGGTWRGGRVKFGMRGLMCIKLTGKCKGWESGGPRDRSRSQLVEMELAWKGLPEDRAKLFLQAQELAPEVRIDTPVWSPRHGGSVARVGRHEKVVEQEKREAIEKAIRETWRRIEGKHDEIAELEEAIGDLGEEESSEHEEGSHVITGDVFAVLRPPA
ncbi:hypothetical protein Pmar_PMAR027393 [Perkinsus marinus ATCC 50983]|uniref:Uncharacterized protein n=1 Tax=Perkinsus marinus (strain ATCC 50983 / TXsc) TaxID=423536 RepID=C5KSG1_PERM5|nr:hypothetical protein Pmar_PMAR027393 [Perkinsus marinus ATCC 50983]EER12575.1 hypothetical protein Pmar_PMAR027393 [Perkinsus marinus ATCC 50983]|eukprot:XP_002780780.1 hypothetical protein Pmar_PMAR027393 [Perkinsus marinus ATCC 50983]